MILIDRNRRLYGWHLFCKAIYPLEAFGYLLGIGQNLRRIWIPEDLADYTSEAEVLIPRQWYVKAFDHAEEHECRVIGTIHSECYGKEYGPHFLGGSGADLQNVARALWGVTVVRDWGDGKRTARTQFWGPIERVRLCRKQTER